MIRTSTGQKFRNVEMVFLVDQNVKIRTSKMSFELIRTTTIRTSKIALKIKNQTFDVLILPMDLKPIRTSKIYISTTYGVLPMVTKACGGLGQGQLGQVRLGQVRLGQVRLGQARLGSITLSQVRLGQVKSGQRAFKDSFFNARSSQHPYAIGS